MIKKEGVALLRFKVIYDGSLLDETHETSPQIMAWTSLPGRTKEFFPVVWANPASTLSTVIDVELPLPFDVASNTLSVRIDDGIGLQAKACTPNPSGQVTLQNVGDARLSLGLELMQRKNDAASLRAAEFDLPMFYHVYWDGKGNRVEKGRVKLHDLHAVDAANHEREVALRLPADFEASIDEFSYLAQNEQFLSSCMQSMMARSIAMFTEEMTAAGFGFTPSSEEMKRIHAPFNYQTSGLLPGFSFLLRPGNPAPEPGTAQYARVQAWLRRIALYALARVNMHEETFVKIVGQQTRETDNVYDDNYTECCAVFGQMLAIPPTSMPYIGDEVYAPKKRVERVAAKNGYPAFSKSSVHSVERFSEMCENDGGDCEDGGMFACRIANTLSAGVWDDALVAAVADVARQYAATLNLGSVLSASLGNSSDDKKLAVDDERDVIDSESDRNVEYGAHMWCEMVPITKFVALVRRAVPDRTASLLWPRTASKAPWTAAVPHLVVEATGRLESLQLPRVAYVINDDAEHTQRRGTLQNELEIDALRKHLLRHSDTLQYMSTVRRQATLENKPNKRINKFYRNTTTVFTTLALEQGLSNISFIIANRGQRVPAPAVADDNRLFEKNPLSKHLRPPGSVAAAAAASAAPAAHSSSTFADDHVRSSSGGGAPVPEIPDVFGTAERKLAESAVFARCAAAEPAECNAALHSLSKSASVRASEAELAKVFALVDSSALSAAERILPINYGVPLYDKLQQVPLPATCLVPGTSVSNREMRAIATLLRQAPPITMPGDWEQIERMHAAKFESRLNNGVDEAERERVEMERFEALTAAVKLVSDAAPVGHTASSKYKHMTFLFDFHLFNKDGFADRVLDDMKQLKASGALARCRLRFEEPMPHRRHACLQLICDVSKIAK